MASNYIEDLALSGVLLPRKPVLVIDPSLSNQELPANFSLWLHPRLHSKAFPLEKLKATKNSLRSAAKEQGASDEGLELLPTPHYNASILEVKNTWHSGRTATLSSRLSLYSWRDCYLLSLGRASLTEAKLGIAFSQHVAAKHFVGYIAFWRVEQEHPRKI